MNKKMDPKMLAAHVILTVLVLAQIILSFFLYSPAYPTITNLGWLVLWISAFLGWYPIIYFRKRGGVPKGKSFVHTTKLVDTGIYSVIRHPQYIAGLLLAFSLILITQSWIILALGIPVMAMFYLGLAEGDQQGIEKFGRQYEEYMKRVPKANFLVGIIRLLRRKRQPGL
jgi:protein-S-isoprenylcysteine O-methyltransferase Ste14